MKNLFAYISVVFLIFIFTFSAQAQTHMPYPQLKMSEKHDYDFVMRTCHLDFDSFVEMLEATKQDSKDYFQYMFPTSPNQIPIGDNFFSRNGIGQHTSRLMNSEGFYLALKTCFPKDEHRRNLYTINLLLLDSFGKVATISIIAVSGASIYKLFSFLGKKLAVAPTVFIFRRLNASEKVLENIPRYMGKAGVYTFNGVTLAAIANYIYEAKKNKDLVMADHAEFREGLIRNLELYKRTIELRARAPTPAAQKAMDLLLAEQRENVLFYINELLNLNIESAERENLMQLREVFMNKSVPKKVV